jgi:hypothetical protein
MNKRNLSVATVLLFLISSPAVCKDLFKTVTQPHTIITGDDSALPAPAPPQKLPGLPAGGSGPINPQQPLPKQSAPPDTTPPPKVPTAKQYQDMFNKSVADTVRSLDVAQDLITFGGHGRQRDIDRASTAEDKSRLVREGSQKAKTEKINGLRNQLQDKEREIRRWKQIIAKYPAVSKQQDLLIDFAKARLEYLGHLQNSLDMASKAVEDSDAALHMFVTLVQSSKIQRNTRAADVWDDVLETLADSIKGSHQTTAAYVVKAISGGSPAAVVTFLTELSGLRGALQSIQETQEQTLESCLKEKQSLELQLAELNK